MTPTTAATCTPKKKIEAGRTLSVA
jgi:hypothetical protein